MLTSDNSFGRCKHTSLTCTQATTHIKLRYIAREKLAHFYPLLYSSKNIYLSLNKIQTITNDEQQKFQYNRRRQRPVRQMQHMLALISNWQALICRIKSQARYRLFDIHYKI